MVIIGLDLAGLGNRPSGLCLLNGMKAQTAILYNDLEIVEIIFEVHPQVIAIDAPLSLPKDRFSIHAEVGSHIRECERKLLKSKIPIFPVTLGPMKKLTERGIALKIEFESKRFKVIEVYPGGAQDVLKISRKRQGPDKLKSGLERIGIEGLKKEITNHELDAVTCALVGKMFLEGKGVVYGDPDEGIIVMPAEP